MAGVRIEVDVSGLKRLQARIARLSAIDRRALLEGIGAEVETQVRRRIAEEKSGPEGTQWPAWSPRYARTRGPRHSLLVGQGDLLDSIQRIASGGQVEVGSNLVYAAIHQFGGAEAGRPGLPARPYLGLGPRDEDEIQRVVGDWLDGLLAAP
jgi:phage virion morphogenesis protein